MSEKSKEKNFKRLIRFAVPVLVLVLALVSAFVPFSALLPGERIPARGAGEVRLHFVNVGQGDCTVVEFADGELLVVDAGNGSFTERNHLIRYLKGLDYTSISLLATHADIDHYGGFSALLAAFPVARCYLPLLDAGRKEYAQFLEAVEEEGCETDVLTRYDTIAGEGAYLVCLSPYSIDETDENDSSAVLYLNAGGVTALLCGDITSAREKRLLREYALDETIFDSGAFPVRLDGIDLLKAAHHGSASSSAAEWLALLRPKAFIVSAGRGNGYGLPSGEALAAFRAASPQGEIYRTDDCGDLVFTLSAGSYRVLQRGNRE